MLGPLNMAGISQFQSSIVSAGKTMIAATTKNAIPKNLRADGLVMMVSFQIIHIDHLVFFAKPELHIASAKAAYLLLHPSGQKFL